MKRILVIEDDHFSRNNLVTILRMEGYAPLAADNGREGLALARSEHPDLILCDVMMPEMDGYEVLAALREDGSTRHIPLIFLAGEWREACN